MALREDMPVVPDVSTPEQREGLAKWEKSIRLSLVAIKRTIAEHLLSGLPDTTSAKDFLTAVGDRYQVSNNAEYGYLMKELMDMSYDHNGVVREFILRMVHIQSKLKAHSIDLNENFIVQHALNCLPIEFTQIKTTYNTIGEQWSVNDLITKCVAEEEKLRKEKGDLALLTIHTKSNSSKSNMKRKKHSYSAPYKKFGNSHHHQVGGPRQMIIGLSFNIKIDPRKPVK
ncbi:hypothetical protein K2173_000339 [Erythroxylum novogranatense]|uniref:Uncharacterized protein n=1 Tax=Erythroxylum novogranatense TaxID=1862640 RepID=A0AAV8SWW5_9ROSI|nr:hypothetical protein K2173_000339 [Erythroxylum novogranatense]